MGAGSFAFAFPLYEILSQRPREGGVRRFRVYLSRPLTLRSSKAIATLVATPSPQGDGGEQEDAGPRKTNTPKRPSATKQDASGPKGGARGVECIAPGDVFRVVRV